MNARNAVVLLGLVAMFVLAMVPTKADDASRLEQSLSPRPDKAAVPVAYVPVATSTSGR